MAHEDRHPHTGGGQLDLGVEDLLGLGHHLPFFLGVARVHEHINVRNDVEGNLLGELHRRRRIGDEDALGLVPELVHGVLAGARDRLIGGHHHALDLCRVVQRLQSNHELGGGAVGVGDDVAPGFLLHVGLKGGGIHLRHNERHFRVITPA